jgi:transposase
MDNLAAHKVNGVEDLIHASGAEVLYLPPYPPDLNPIEKAWAKLKQLLRSARARTKEALEQDIEDALKLIFSRQCSSLVQACYYNPTVTVKRI